MARKSEGEQVMKEYTFNIRTLSRTGRDPVQGLLSREDHEEYIRQMVADGWTMMGQPQMVGMAAYNQEPNAGFNLMYWWERGTM